MELSFFGLSLEIQPQDFLKASPMWLKFLIKDLMSECNHLNSVTQPALYKFIADFKSAARSVSTLARGHCRGKRQVVRTLRVDWMTLFQTVEFILTLKANCFELTPLTGPEEELGL